MPKFAANLTTLFTELPLEDRFAASREAGFAAVEFLFPYPYDLRTIARALATNKLEMVLFDLPPGDWERGDRGIASDPRRVEEFRAGVDEAVRWARGLGVRRLNCLAGKRIPELPEEVQWGTLLSNIRYAAEELARHGLRLTIEPLNSYDVPGFLLTSSAITLRLLDEAGSPNAFLQYDVYHMQRMEGELTTTLRRNLPRIGHIQIADNPGRHQPGTGEINYRFLLAELDRLGYDGYVALEYIPVPDTPGSLRWLEEYGFKL
ncbi:MAG: hydroxypyruvate isomerase [Firmicutes bacterium]|nr:hydroxypyruvate isomerase [Bacillota bacterium]MCL5039223.1 hydroxypyruvate isomerase [Bacillota bacterium]